MVELNEQIAEMFKKRLSSEVKSHSQLGTTFHAIRAQLGQTLSSQNVVQSNLPIHHEVSGKIHVLYFSQSRLLTGVIAVYPDQQILWLDDHNSDKDFVVFSQRETLYQWAKDKPNQLIELLIATKFNHAGFPQLISNVSEIPLIPEASSDIVTKKRGEDEIKLVSLANQIFSPQVDIEKLEHQATIKFCLWTQIEGNVINVQCTLEANGTFKYVCDLLVTNVGNAFPMR